MRTRNDNGRSWRRHPVLTTAALVALAPMMPSTLGGGDLAAPAGDVTDDDVSEEPDDVVPADAAPVDPEPVIDELVDSDPVDDLAVDGVPVDEPAGGESVDGDVDDDGASAGELPPTEAVDDVGAGGDGAGGDDTGELIDEDALGGEPGVVEQQVIADETGGAGEECTTGDESTVVDDDAADATADDAGEAGDDEAADDAAGGDSCDLPDDGADVIDEPVADEPVIDEPVVDEPVVDEAVADEPVVDEPVVDEPVTDEPIVDVAPAEVDAGADRLEPVVSDDGVVDDAAEVDDAGSAVDADVDVDEPPAFDDPGLRAEIYDGVYAQGVPIWVAMSATRQLESGGDYRAEARGSSASGAYQVIDSTWNRYGGYARAVDAPPAVQDQFAYESMTAILKRYGNEVAAIPVAWYYPAALRNPSLMDIVPVPQAGNVLTPRQYQGRWMAAFHRYLEAGSPVFLPTDTDPLIPAIAFPVLGPTWFYDDWHADRDGGLRRHEGLDFLGEDGQPLRAAFDGVVTRVRPNNLGRAGVGITITRADGIRANYFHLDSELKWHPDLEIGDTVKAGQVIAYMGSTGNAGIPHLHFEIRTEDGDPIAPYPAVLEAIQREQCSVGIGPWSTEFSSPATIAEQLAERLAAQAAEARADATDATDATDVTDVTDVTEVLEVEPVVHEIEGPDGARWTVVDGRAVTATGVGALIAPDQGDCTNVPDELFGTDAGGLSVDLLPEEWWGDDVDPDELAEMVAAVAAERSHEFERRILDTDDAVVRMLLAGGGRLSASVLLTKHDAAALLAGDAHPGHEHAGPEQDDGIAFFAGPAPR